MPSREEIEAVALVVLEFLWVLVQSFYTLLVAIVRFFVPPEKKSVVDKVVLVTGAAHGLGRLLALQFGKLGAKVVLLDVNKEQNLEVAQEISKAGGTAKAYTCDVSEENQVAEVAEKIRRDVGEVDILVNNAGVLPGQPLMKLTGNQIRKTLQVNTLSHFWTIREFLPRMLQNGGHIVAISSIAGMLGCANLVDYCASKHAVVGLMSALREELYAQGKEDRVQLTIICPCVMDTGLVRKPKTRFPKLLPIIKVEEAAEVVMNGILRNQRHVVIPPVAHIIHKVAKLFPDEVPSKVQRFLDYTMDPN